MARIIRLVFLLLALLSAACERRAVAAEPRVVRDLRYAETPGVDAKLQSLDIYAPPHNRIASVCLPQDDCRTGISIEGVR